MIRLGNDLPPVKVDHDPVLSGLCNKHAQERFMVRSVGVTIGVQRSGREDVDAVPVDPEEPQVGISLIQHPAEVVVQILLNTPIGTGDKAEAGDPVVGQFELLLPDGMRASQHNREKDETGRSFQDMRTKCEALHAEATF